MGDSGTMHLIDFLVAGYNFLPSVLFFTGLAALALGWVPKLGKVVYICLIYSFMLNYFCVILDLPDGFSITASQNCFPQMPLEYIYTTSFITITVYR